MQKCKPNEPLPPLPGFFGLWCLLRHQKANWTVGSASFSVPSKDPDRSGLEKTGLFELTAPGYSLQEGERSLHHIYNQEQEE